MIIHLHQRTVRQYTYRRIASAQSRQSLRYSHTWNMEVDEGCDQKIRHLAPWMAAHACLKNEFTEDEKCHNLMSWLIFRLTFSTILNEPCHAKTRLRTTVTRHDTNRFAQLQRQSKVLKILDRGLIIWASTWQNQQSDCAPSEDSDQPGHPPSLIRVFPVRSMSSLGPKLSSCGQRRLWSDWADAQADLSLRWAHSHFVGFVLSRLKSVCSATETI